MKARVKDTFFEKKHLINCRGSFLDLSTPKIMGVLNVTPDSFYDGGRYESVSEVISHVSEMIREGADIIDIGAYSSHPGAIHISEKEEFDRLEKVVSKIRGKYPEQILSVDTFRAGIAQRVVRNFSVDIINDISGGNLDESMFDVIADLQVPYIIMHMPGNPQTMQQQTAYKDIVREILTYLGAKVHGLRKRGIADIIVDPGFGFGKTLEQNYALLAHLDEFQILKEPIMVGISRKSMIYKYLGLNADGALNGTTALHMHALIHGANILRVHDVKEARQTIELFNKIQEEKNKYVEEST
jgi:dihydropteroate synthase